MPPPRNRRRFALAGIFISVMQLDGGKKSVPLHVRGVDESFERNVACRFERYVRLIVSCVPSRINTVESPPQRGRISRTQSRLTIVDRWMRTKRLASSRSDTPAIVSRNI